MAESRQRRAFTAEFKVEAVRRMAERRAADSMGQRNRASKRAAGVSKSSVLRGRAFSLAAT